MRFGLARAINLDLFRAAKQRVKSGPSVRDTYVSQSGLRPDCSYSASKLTSHPLDLFRAAKQRVKSGPSVRDT